MVIWKFDLERTLKQTIEMPKGAIILSVGMQNGEIKLWAACDPTEEDRQRTFYLCGTGQSTVDDPWVRFRGTVMDGDFVWHVFARD